MKNTFIPHSTGGVPSHTCRPAPIGPRKQEDDKRRVGRGRWRYGLFGIIDCVCDQPSNWKTEERTLNRLRGMVIIDLEGTDHVATLVSWARKLENRSD
jgi:hypothetical protein